MTEAVKRPEIKFNRASPAYNLIYGEIFICTERPMYHWRDTLPPITHRNCFRKKSPLLFYRPGTVPSAQAQNLAS